MYLFIFAVKPLLVESKSRAHEQIVKFIIDVASTELSSQGILPHRERTPMFIGRIENSKVGLAKKQRL